MPSKIVEERCLVMDIDGTLCEKKPADLTYSQVRPIARVAQALKEYKANGFHIILHTSRNMRTHGGSIGRINADTLKVLMNWLDDHKIPYDEIHIGKPWPGRGGFYVDDLAIRPSELVTHSYEEIQSILSREAEFAETSLIEEE